MHKVAAAITGHFLLIWLATARPFRHFAAHARRLGLDRHAKKAATAMGINATSHSITARNSAVKLIPSSRLF
jgi:hypothetical protein